MTSYGDNPPRPHRDWQAPETSADVAGDLASRWGEADWTRGAATKQEQSNE